MEIIIKSQAGCKFIFTDDTKESYFLTILDSTGAELSKHIVFKEDFKRLAKAS